MTLLVSWRSCNSGPLDFKAEWHTWAEIWMLEHLESIAESLKDNSGLPEIPVGFPQGTVLSADNGSEEGKKDRKLLEENAPVKLHLLPKARALGEEER